MLWAGLGSIHFFQFNSIPIQVGFKIFQFNSILIQIGFRIFQFNSNSIPFLSIPIQFNSNFMHRNKQISQIIGYFKFNLNISLFAAQFRKYIIQDHNNSRINTLGYRITVSTRLLKRRWIFLGDSLIWYRLAYSNFPNFRYFINYIPTDAILRCLTRYCVTHSFIRLTVRPFFGGFSRSRLNSGVQYKSFIASI